MFTDYRIVLYSTLERGKYCSRGCWGFGRQVKKWLGKGIRTIMKSVWQHVRQMTSGIVSGKRTTSGHSTRMYGTLR